MRDRGIGIRLDEVRLALMLLTRFPVGGFAGVVPSMSASAWAWPLAGVAVGAVAAGGLALAQGLGLPPPAAALLALAVGALCTGAMHEDGLADLADGFGGGATRERKLEIMRDSRIGSYGVVALVLSLGFRATAIAALFGGGAGWALIGLAAVTRAMLPTALVLLPAARSDGLGNAAVGDETPAIPALAVGFLCLLPLGLGAAVVVFGAVALASVGLGLLARRQIGGQTGDVLGAMQQAGEIAGWAALLFLAA
ncbi:adenosylcobinamide-GDP ribazoletransferase [Defluviimonas sp. WL0002]|uniref:Adenosylcobinamide-GDP ribazoletransferase n=1 Tax=Albidovulum marisflavi TaxID=2984159 RepID=A0ABT2Z9G9_9RHOB|nr:adenosylcobinamide-GDP ribazoletransferase [Defluviimonas sp. WL0002]MCV2867762.1 adenosylcobinamide-GDP ribazoletransferase [Defluviimonas sp. WL0002]